MTCTLDTPQQGLDLVESLITQMSKEDISDITLGINIGASDLFDAVSVFEMYCLISLQINLPNIFGSRKKESTKQYLARSRHVTSS